MNVPIRHLPAEPALPRVPAAGMAPSLERKRLRLYLAQMLVDVALLMGSFFVAGTVYFDGEIPSQPFLAAQPVPLPDQIERRIAKLFAMAPVAWS